MKPAIYSLEALKLRSTPDANGCWLWNGALNHAGYGHFYTGDQRHRAHRASWVASHGAIPDGLHVLHHCDVPRCVNPAHLFLGTHRDNMADCKRKGRTAHLAGERSGTARLNNVAVRVIRLLRSRGYTLKALADAHGVTIQAISLITNRRNWRHVA